MTNSKYSNDLTDEAFRDVVIDWIDDRRFDKDFPNLNYKQIEWIVDNCILEKLAEYRTNTIKAALEALPERPHRPAHNEAHMRLDCAACMLKKAESNLTALIGGDDE